MGPVVGIDFGTTNSLCAFLDGDRPSVIPNTRGMRTTPSVVAATAKGEYLVGESAKNQALVNPENTVSSVKRLLGSTGLLSMGDRSWRPEELVAMILGSLRKDAERHLGRDVTEAVITAPAHFSDRERRALVEAGRLAGLEVLRIVNEPTAAAVARAWGALSKEGAGSRSGSAKASSIVLVYDFGGGTFDVTLLAQEGPECTVLSSRGDGRLGGQDLDAELRRLAASAFREEYGLDVDADRFLAQQLSEAAERAKIELSERDQTVIGIPFALAGGKVVHPALPLSRASFEALALPFVERSIELARRALEDARIPFDSVDELVLSGGSSRIPLVRRLLAERLGLEPEGGVNPEEIVALGAAAWAALASGSERLRVRDVVSRTYGVEIDGGRFVPLIRKNSPVPSSKSRVFTTVQDSQDSVEIHVLQGEGAAASENLSLGRFLLSGIRPANAGEPRIRVDFSIDESDMLQVGARDLDTGAEQAISIADLDRGASSDSREELERKTTMLADRLIELKDGLVLERGLEAEIDELRERALAASSGAAAALPEGELRLLKAELEGLVGELLARRSERNESGEPRARLSGREAVGSRGAESRR
jgi:molecular chaperone DnaK